MALLFCLADATAFSQKGSEKELFFLYDSKWEPCKPEMAKYLAFVQHPDDTTWRWNYYHFTGPLIRIETFKDEDATIPNGYFGYFDKKGKIDSAGFTIKGLKNGSWYYYGDSITPQLTKEYAMGKLIREKLTEPRPEADAVTKPGDKEADFPGGVKNWVKYLQKTIKTPERAANFRTNNTALIAFAVNVKGEIEDEHIVSSVEYSADQEALRVIRNSPPWIPAEQDGHKVKAYRIQPITFQTN
jgi:protein TonB